MEARCFRFILVFLRVTGATPYLKNEGVDRLTFTVDLVKFGKWLLAHPAVAVTPDAF